MIMGNNRIESIYRLTPMQEGILFQYLNDSSMYFEQFSCELEGTIDVEAFKKAWQKLIDEHPVLRTVFVWEQLKRPMQVVLKDSSLEFMEMDWKDTCSSEDKKKKALEAFLAQDRKLGFDLSLGPLMRFALIELAENKYQFIWSFHHIIIDGMSLPLILEQVNGYYKAFSTNEACPVFEKHSFQTYVNWLKDQSRDDAIAYWNNYLKNDAAGTSFSELKIHTDSVGNDRYNIQLAPELTDEIENVMRKTCISQYQFYCLAYAVLLSEMCYRKEIVFGVTVSGRPLEVKGIDKTIGIFINTVPERFLYRPDVKVIDYLEEMNKAYVERNPYEYLPLSDIMKENSLFESIFLFENYGIEKLYDDNSDFCIKDVVLNENINFPLAWMIRPGEKCTLDVVFDSSIFSRKFVRTMSDAYMWILQEMLTHLRDDISTVTAIDGNTAIEKNIDSEYVCDINGHVLPSGFKGRLYRLDHEKALDEGMVGRTDDNEHWIIFENESDRIKVNGRTFDVHCAEETLSGELKVNVALIKRTDISNSEHICVYYDKADDQAGIHDVLMRLFGKESETIIEYCPQENIQINESGEIVRKKLLSVPVLSQSVLNRCREVLISNNFNGDVEVSGSEIAVKVNHSGYISEISKLVKNFNDDYGVPCRIKVIDEDDTDKSCEKAEYNPVTETEKALFDVWKQVLGNVKISDNDSFFDLGGNSIAIMQVISRLKKDYGIESTISDFFDYETLPDMAAAVESRKKELADKDATILTAEQKENGVISSFSQQTQWFLYKFQPKSSFYNTSEEIRISGELKLDVFNKALDSVIERHDALRTVFYMEGDTVYQRVRKHIETPLTLLTLNQIEKTGDLNKDLEKLLYEEVSRPFNLGEGPLFRGILVKCDENEYIFTLVMHHIISDGWSMGIFFNDLMKYYDCYKNDREVTFPPVVWQYSDYSAWFRNWYREDVFDKEFNYWKEKLEGTSELDFPLDYERPSVQTFKGEKAYFTFRNGFMNRIRACAEATGTTTFMVLLAGLSVLLYRYCNQEDVVIGSPIAGRGRSEVENTIGCFMNVLVYRNNLGQNPSFKELLSRVKKIAIEAYDNQNMPFELLVDKLGIKRDLSKNPIYQIMFVLQNEMHPLQEVDSLKIERLVSENKSAMLDLWISLQEKEEDAELVIEYNTDLFKPETIDRIAEHFERILNILTTSPDTKIQDFEYMSEAEINYVVYELNGTDYKFSTDLFIHQLFEEQVMLHPDKEAVKFEDISLTYRELNERVNKLANYLIDHKYGRNQMVAVYMERSIEMVVAIYGILKAGAAYVPVDSSYPEERIKFMIEDSDVSLILTQKNKLEYLNQYNADKIALDENDVISAYSSENPNVHVEPDDYAYMIYTSGSTGGPKGVINTHRGIRNRILWIRTYFKYEENGRQMQKTPFSFDCSCGEFFGALTVGATLVVARPEGHRDVDYLIDLIEKEHITHIHFVPSMLKAFLENPEIDRTKELHQVCCTGEAMPYSLVEKFKHIFPECDLFNLYGPTEAAVEVSCWNCRDMIDGKVIPIGKPIVNTQFYVLDTKLHPVPVGVRGELYIAGDNLAKGYYKKDELTKKAFIRNPFCKGNNSIMYKTGDIVRLHSDGVFEFIGRADSQVKIRGNRIELGEIEFVLHKAEEVQDVNVIVSKEQSPRILAYLIPRDKDLIQNEEKKQGLITKLRELISNNLPQYMMPSFFIFLDSMPLLPNGKLDRKKLPIPQIASKRTVKTVVANDTEARLLKIWSDVLGFKDIDVCDNFFDLGGHSLLLIQVHNRIREEFDTNITVIDMFKYPTIRSQAKMIEEFCTTYHEIADLEEKATEHNSARSRNREHLKNLRGREGS